MTDFTFPTEKQFSRLTLARAETLNARFTEVATASATKLDKVGGTISGNLAITGNFSVGGTFSVTGAATFSSTLTLSGDPTLALQAGTKQYIDAGDAALAAAKLSLSGGTMSGAIAMGGNKITGAGDPVDAQDLVTKAVLTATAFSSALPSQTGNAGKFVTTDGSNASWQSVYPTQTGNAGKVLGTDGSQTAWVNGGLLTRSARTSNTQLGAADSGKFIDITSGTFTQTFAACATLGSGWWCYLSNSGNGDITLEPDGSETIDSLASFVMYPKETRLVLCDGTALRSSVVNSYSKTFTSSGTYTKPPGYTYHSGEIFGAGGDGGKSTSSNHSGGGGGGACVPFLLPSASISATEVVTIAAAGTGRTTAGTGSDGGISTFGSLVAGYGGGGGGGSSSANYSGGGGGGGLEGGYTGSTTGTVNGGLPFISGGPIHNPGYGGGSGSTGIGGTSAFGGGGGGGNSPGGASLYGGGGGGGSGTGSPTTYAGGNSVFAGDGGAGNDSTSGADGSAPSGGGGGTRTGTRSGAGARGEFRIRGVI